MPRDLRRVAAASLRSSRDRPVRRAAQACGPHSISALRCGEAQAAAAPAATPSMRAGDRRDVENLGADGDADPRRRIVTAPPEHGIGQVLDREIAVRRVGARHEAAQGGIVGFVEVHRDT